MLVDCSLEFGRVRSCNEPGGQLLGNGTAMGTVDGPRLPDRERLRY